MQTQKFYSFLSLYLLFAPLEIFIWRNVCLGGSEGLVGTGAAVLGSASTVQGTGAVTSLVPAGLGTQLPGELGMEGTGAMGRFGDGGAHVA